MENKKKNIWGIIIQTLITILTAIGTSLGVTIINNEQLIAAGGNTFRY